MWTFIEMHMGKNYSSLVICFKLTECTQEWDLGVSTERLMEILTQYSAAVEQRC